MDAVVPQQSFSWLRPFIPKKLQPYIRGARKRLSGGAKSLPEPYRSAFPFTVVHPVRQRNLVDLASSIERENIPGAVIECGVLDGGTAALMAWATRNRNVHLFDAWQGLPDTVEQDGKESEKWVGSVVGSPARALAAQRALGIPRSRVHVHHGWFDETFPKADINPVALLHIDCDFYEPTKLCLDKWYPVLSPGGAVQIDDYSAFPGSKKAVDEFLADHSEIKLEVAGELAFYFRKPLA